ncbi:M1 family metallopeptidase [Allosphingosinicella sp.]|uniref:M1 family metallopeptidase n=1 Tax=Allosphingosinicella sp. TaxID=2823234 RepID=UPI002FC22127
MLHFSLPRTLGAAFAAATLLLAACSSEKQADAPPVASDERMVAPILTTEDAKDVHSYARPEIARVTHVALDLVTDFDAKRIGGTATLDIQAAEGAREIVLDTKGLDVRSVTNGQGQMLPWKLGAADENLGAPLTVQLNGAKQIRVTYRSAPDAAALQWLAPEQTSGKKYPFLFSQGQAILNRTWIPTQDSPGIRQTWEARIVVPAPLKAVMSAQNLMPEGEEVEGGRAFHFKMDKPVAPYLIALAVGDIAFQSLGPRTGVYAEPSMLKAAANELVDTEKMVEAAERLYGPYQWGRYDMIVLPPAFPFGGMENPRLTFLTPTILAGDKSLVSLIAHELAHSWSGNLVTNATWADFWLNEGVTTYIESRIMEEVYGRERAAQLIELGWEELEAAIREAGVDSPSTRLHLDLADRDPDEGMSSIAYDKGAAFLRTIDRAVGRQRFDQWLRGYFDRHAFQPITSALFLADLRQHLIQGDEALEERLRLDEWVYEPGLPGNAVVVRSESFRAVDQAAQGFALGSPAASLAFPKWNYAERVRFLNALPRELPTERLTALDTAFGLSKSTNSEVLFAWLQLAIANRYQPAVPALERFLTTQGRRKFVAPLFESLVAQGEWGRPIATRIYAKARPAYHSVTTGTVDQILSEESGDEAAEAGAAN